MPGIVTTNIRTFKKRPPSPRYGVSYNINDSAPALTRLYDSVGMVANAGTSLTDEPQNDFDSVWPFSGIVEETISDRVMMKIPKFYIRRELIDDVMEIVICKEKFDDSYIPHEMFLKGFTQWTGANPESDYNNYTYVARYQMSSNAQSKPNVNVNNNQTRVTLRTQAKAIGDGWSILDIATWDGLQKLFMIVFATRNSRSIMPGFSRDTGLDQLTGLTTGAKASCVQRGDQSMSFYNIENLYGKYSSFCDGINTSATQSYICTDISKYADNTATNYRQLNYVTTPFATGGAYISKLGFDTNNKFAQFATETKGSSTTYFCGRYNTTSSGWAVCDVGQDNSSAITSSLFCFYTTKASTSGSMSITSRLIYRPI